MLTSFQCGYCGAVPCFPSDKLPDSACIGDMRQWLIGKGWRQRRVAAPPAHLELLLDDSELPFTDASYFCGHCRDSRNFAAETVVAIVDPSDEVAGSTGVAPDEQKAALVAAVAKLEADLSAKIKELNVYRNRKTQDAKRVQDRKRAAEELRRFKAEETRDREEVRGRGRPIPPRDAIADCRRTRPFGRRQVIRLTTDEVDMLEQIRAIRAATKTAAAACSRAKGQCICSQPLKKSLLNRFIDCCASGLISNHNVSGQLLFWQCVNMPRTDRKTRRWRFRNGGRTSLTNLFSAAYHTHSASGCLRALSMGIPMPSMSAFKKYLDGIQPQDAQLYGWLRNNFDSFAKDVIDAQTKRRAAPATVVAEVSDTNPKLAAAMAWRAKSSLFERRALEDGDAAPERPDLAMLLGPCEAGAFGDCRTPVEWLFSIMQRVEPPCSVQGLLETDEGSALVVGCGVPRWALEALGAAPLSWARLQSDLGLDPSDQELQRLQCAARRGEVPLELLQSLARPPSRSAFDMPVQTRSMSEAEPPRRLQRTWTTHSRTFSASSGSSIVEEVVTLDVAAMCALECARLAASRAAPTAVPSLASICVRELSIDAGFLPELLQCIARDPPRRPGPPATRAPARPVPAAAAAAQDRRVTRSQTLPPGAAAAAPNYREDETEEAGEGEDATEFTRKAKGARCSFCDSRKLGPDNPMLLCDTDGCTHAWHTACLPVPLGCVPWHDWYCPNCAPPVTPADLVQFRAAILAAADWDTLLASTRCSRLYWQGIAQAATGDVPLDSRFALGGLAAQPVRMEDAERCRASDAAWLDSRAQSTLVRAVEAPAAAGTVDGPVVRPPLPLVAPPPLPPTVPLVIKFDAQDMRPISEMRYSRKARGLVLRGDDNVAEVFPHLDLECAPPVGLGRVALQADLNRLTQLIDSSVTALSTQAEGAGLAFVVAKEAARAAIDAAVAYIGGHREEVCKNLKLRQRTLRNKLSKLAAAVDARGSRTMVGSRQRVMARAAAAVATLTATLRDMDAALAPADDNMADDDDDDGGDDDDDDGGSEDGGSEDGGSDEEEVDGGNGSSDEEENDGEVGGSGSDEEEADGGHDVEADANSDGSEVHPGDGSEMASDEEGDGGSDGGGDAAAMDTCAEGLAAPKALIKRLPQLRQVVIDTISAVRRLAGHLMVYRACGLDDNRSTACARFTYATLPPKDRLKIVEYLRQKVRDDSDGRCEVITVVCDDEVENQKGLVTEEDTTPGQFKATARSEAARLFEELEARRQALRAAADGKVAGWRNETEAAQVRRQDKRLKADLAATILGQMVRNPPARSPEADGSMVLHGLGVLQSMTVREVGEWLRELGHPASAGILERKRVAGYMLEHLTDADLCHAGIVGDPAEQKQLLQLIKAAALSRGVLKSMNAKEVGEWLRELGHPASAAILEQAGVAGYRLEDLTDDDLADGGIEDAGERAQLLQLIKAAVKGGPDCSAADFVNDINELVGELKRQAAERTPDGGRNAFEVMADGAVTPQSARISDLLEFMCPFRSKWGSPQQLKMAHLLHLCVADSEVTVRVLRQHLAQVLLEQALARRLVDNPALPKRHGQHLTLPGQCGIMACQTHKHKCLATGLMKNAMQPGDLMNLGDLIKAAKSAQLEWLVSYLEGKKDQQCVAFARALIYCNNLQDELWLSGNRATAAFMRMFMRLFLSWDARSLDPGTRARSDEMARRLLMVALGRGLHSAHINLTSKAGRVGGMTLQLIGALIKNIEGMQQVQADYPTRIVELKQRGFTQDDLENYFACLMSWFSGFGTVETVEPSLLKSDRLHELRAMSDEDRGFAMPKGRCKKYDSPEGRAAAAAWNDAQRSGAPGRANTRAMDSYLDHVARLAARAAKAEFSIRQEHHARK